MNKVKNAISKKRQALESFREIPTASNETELLKISLKIENNAEEAKYNHFSKVFSNGINKLNKFYETLNERTG